MADQPDIELQGVSHGVRGKALYFQADDWDAPEYLPMSQITIVPDRESDQHGRCTVFVPAWLAKKNGWD